MHTRIDGFGFRITGTVRVRLGGVTPVQVRLDVNFANAHTSQLLFQRLQVGNNDRVCITRG